VAFFIFPMLKGTRRHNVFGYFYAVALLETMSGWDLGIGN
jgi:hypothetical protein